MKRIKQDLYDLQNILTPRNRENEVHREELNIIKKAHFRRILDFLNEVSVKNRELFELYEFTQ
jgi:ABC-type phosphate/phosphonate transport system ATPase subunit